MSFGLGSSDLLEIRRLKTIVAANNPKNDIFRGAPGPLGPTGPPGPATFMNGGYEYRFSPQESGIPNGSFSFSPGKDLLEATQLQLSMQNNSGALMNDLFFHLPVGSRVFLYNKVNSITHVYVIRSHLRYNGVYIFEVTLTTPISYIPVENEAYIISFSIRGPPGEGIAAGGLPGQILVKATDKDFDTMWSPSLPYIARGRIPNSSDIAYSSLPPSKKWSGQSICKLTGSDMADLTLSGDPSVFLNGTFTGQQQWSVTFNTSEKNISNSYTVLPPSYIGNSHADAPFYISAGPAPPIGSGTSWILWNV